MSAGLYASPLVVERFISAPVAGNLSQPFVAPCDLEVVGLVAHVGTAPGGSVSLAVNVIDAPTSQPGVSSYALWTAANVPTISGAAVNSFSAVAKSVVDNVPYALNYPLPGPGGTTGFVTAQQTTQVTDSPVLAPPSILEYSITPLVQPDNVYNDLNGQQRPASIVHAGDVLTFTVAGVGAAANLEIVLYAEHR